MTRRDWWIGIALLVVALALLMWVGQEGQRQTQRSLDSLSQRLDAKEQARIDMLEARIITLEKTQARLRARLEGD